MIAIEKDIEKYMSEVSSHLFCLQKNKKAVLEDIREAILEFTENNEVETIDVIYSRFGTPEEIAKAYIADLDPKLIKKKISIRKILILTLVITFVLLSAFLIGTLIGFRGDLNGTISVTLEEETTIFIENIISLS